MAGGFLLIEAFKATIGVVQKLGTYLCSAIVLGGSHRRFIVAFWAQIPLVVIPKGTITREI